MAFTDEERFKVRTALGFSTTGRDYQPEIESGFDTVAADAAAVSRVQAILADLDEVFEQLQQARGRLKYEELDRRSIVYAGQREVESLRATGRRLVRELGIVFGLEPVRDVFGETAQLGGRALRG